MIKIKLLNKKEESREKLVLKNIKKLFFSTSIHILPAFRKVEKWVSHQPTDLKDMKKKLSRALEHMSFERIFRILLKSYTLKELYFNHCS